MPLLLDNPSLSFLSLTLALVISGGLSTNKKLRMRRRDFSIARDSGDNPLRAPRTQIALIAGAFAHLY